jgi:hypothetical protein
MKAFIVDRYGSKEGLRFGEMPDPEMREDDVLIQVHAAGVNPLDSKIRDGEFKLILPYRLPLILATMWLALWSGWDHECGDSRLATTSMLVPIRIELVLSRNSFRSEKIL